MIKRSLLHIILLLAYTLCSYAQITDIWYEQFNAPDPANNSTSDAGATAWTSTGPSAPTPTSYFKTGFGAMLCVQTDTECVFTSESIDISAHTDVRVTMDIGVYASATLVMPDSNYIRAYYVLDDGSEVLLNNGDKHGHFTGNYFTNKFETQVASVKDLNGDSLRIIIRAFTTNSGNINNFFFDNIRVHTSTSDQRFSRVNGDWSNGTTWSLTSGGAACSCIPDVFSEVTLSARVTLDVDASYTKLDISGQLAYDANVTLTGYYDDTLNITGRLDNINPYLDGRVAIVGNGVINSSGVSAQTGDLIITGNSSVLLTGDSTFEVIDELYLNASGSSLNIDLSDSLIVYDLFYVLDTGISLTNNLSSIVEIKGGFTMSAAPTDTGNNYFTNNGTFNLRDVFDAGGINITFNNYGFADFDSSFSGTMGGRQQFYNRNNGYAKWSGTGGVGMHFYAIGDSNTYEFDGADQTVFRPQGDRTYGNLILSGSGTKRSGQNIVIEGDLTIANNITLDINTSSVNLTSGGDINYLGGGSDILMGVTDTITFNGTRKQTITNVPSDAYRVVVINNTSDSGIYITTSRCTVLANLVLTDGIVHIDNVSQVYLNGSTSGGNDTSFIQGPVRRSGNSNFTFPTGSGVWAPIRCQNWNFSIIPSGFYVEVEYVDSALDNFNIAAGDTMPFVSGREYWNVDLSTTMGFNDVSLVLFWKDSARSGITNYDDLTIAHYGGPGTGWDEVGISAITQGEQGSAQVNGVSTFSPFTFGTQNATNPLPVELISFTGHRLNNGNIKLHWITAMEQNASHYDVLRSQDGISFNSIFTVPSKGDANYWQEYTAIDIESYSGTSYYRLKQFDNDGSSTFSNIISIHPISKNENHFNLLTNPVIGGVMLAEIRGIDQAVITIHDIMGITYHHQGFTALNSEEQHYIFSLNVQDKFPKGIYIVSLAYDGNIVSKKMVIQ